MEKEEIDLSDHHLTDEAVMELLINPIGSEVESLLFRNNFLTDVFVEKIFQRPLEKAKIINF